jgi:hypothetical protein
MASHARWRSPPDNSSTRRSGETFHVGQHKRLVDMRPVLPAEAAKRAMPRITPKRRQFADREARCRRHRLRQIGERAGELTSAPFRQRPPGEGNGAGACRLLARQQLDQRRLARTIVADQPVDARAPQFERDRAKQRPLADGKPHRVDMEGGLGSSHGHGVSSAATRMSNFWPRRPNVGLTMKHDLNSQHLR